MFHQRKTFEPHDIKTGKGDYLISRDKLMLLVDKNQVIRLQLEDYEMLDSDLGSAGFKFIHTSGPLDKFLLVDVKLASDLSEAVTDYERMFMLKKLTKVALQMTEISVVENPFIPR